MANLSTISLPSRLLPISRFSINFECCHLLSHCRSGECDYRAHMFVCTEEVYEELQMSTMAWIEDNSGKSLSMWHYCLRMSNALSPLFSKISQDQEKNWQKNMFFFPVSPAAASMTHLLVHRGCKHNSLNRNNLC